MKLRRFRHLSKRFFVALWPAAPSPQDLEWAESFLWEGERGLFATLPNHDRRHLIGVARRVDALLGDLSEERWIAAALLHDVGKAQSGLGPIRRAFA
ncbi:MAG: HD domain-containing protein, partial [Actinobacteria bacterium]|nr:HD domain-containing protein [Actinomycetota bacterium]